MSAAVLNGFFTSLALILAIGAQNAFVLRQGILRRHVFWVVLACALSDALLISAGVAGFAGVVTAFPALPRLMALAGAGFLLVYGFLKFRAAWRGGDAQAVAGQGTSLRAALATTLALTWLNPHVYLDTLGLIGAVSVQYDSIRDKTGFAGGAIAASFLFFFALGFGARFLAPLMKNPRTWQILDVLIGVLMLYLAIGLLRGL